MLVTKTVIFDRVIKLLSDSQIAALSHDHNSRLETLDHPTIET